MNISALKQQAERHGWSRAVGDVALGAVNRAVLLKVLKGVKIHEPNPAFLKCDPKYAGRFLDAATLRAFATRPEFELDAAFVEAALAKGDECYALVCGDDLAAYGWYSNKPTEIEVSGLEVHFDPSYMYMYKGFTHARHRGQRLHAIGMTRALQAYLARGYRGLVSYVEWNNFDSLRSCYRMGYDNFGDVYVTRLLGRYLVWTDAGCRTTGFTLAHAG